MVDSTLNLGKSSRTTHSIEWVFCFLTVSTIKVSRKHHVNITKNPGLVGSLRGQDVPGLFGHGALEGGERGRGGVKVAAALALGQLRHGGVLAVALAVSDHDGLLAHVGVWGHNHSASQSITKTTRR